MFIYSIKEKNNKKEIYIGKTTNIINRAYSHKSAAKNSERPLYEWIRKCGGWENMVMEEIKECEVIYVDYWEQYYISFYEKQGYVLHNLQLTKGYNPIKNIYTKVSQNKKEAIWDIYCNTSLTIYEIAEDFAISTSMLSKIVQEHGGSLRKNKLEDYYEEIQMQIQNGVPIRQLARKYHVCKNAISNINKGITAYNPNLQYPLNEKVRDEIFKQFQFKPKV